MIRRAWPWAEQSALPGVPHKLALRGASGTSAANAARQWARRNGHTVQAVVFGDWIVTMWRPTGR